MVPNLAIAADVPTIRSMLGNYRQFELSNSVQIGNRGKFEFLCTLSKTYTSLSEVHNQKEKINIGFSNRDIILKANNVLFKFNLDHPELLKLNNNDGVGDFKLSRVKAQLTNIQFSMFKSIPIGYQKNYFGGRIIKKHKKFMNKGREVDDESFKVSSNHLEYDPIGIISFNNRYYILLNLKVNGSFTIGNSLSLSVKGQGQALIHIATGWVTHWTYSGDGELNGVRIDMQEEQKCDVSGGIRSPQELGVSWLFDGKADHTKRSQSAIVLDTKTIGHASSQPSQPRMPEPVVSNGPDLTTFNRRAENESKISSMARSMITLTRANVRDYPGLGGKKVAVLRKGQVVLAHTTRIGTWANSGEPII